ncbi:WhiB family transcriptional regulator [Kutzneria chonburiensis]|uniref:WhiB family transcriptional regulator n=1 Tax=Kutzneria chonburiensis TaxID=1483604 RepID=A0ABV6MI56_9PSEU|nr:WhiB family transcriptional regulator [Kutzneria chonburiensis]
MNNRHALYAGHKTLMMALFGPTGRPAGWRTEAACVDTDPEMFEDQHRIGEAAQVCHGCPVRDLCATDQLDWEKLTSPRRRFPSGYVGGLTATARHAIHCPPMAEAA